jgi:hypothetical protein
VPSISTGPEASFVSTPSPRPAAAAHLALVCPSDRSRDRAWVLHLAYALTLALAAVYQLFLYEPRAYSAIHNAAQALTAVPVLVFAGLLALAQSAPPPPLGARGARFLFLGALGGLVIPGAVFAISGLSGGLVPVHVASWVGCAFPAACIAALWPARAAEPAFVASRA